MQIMPNYNLQTNTSHINNGKNKNTSFGMRLRLNEGVSNKLARFTSDAEWEHMQDEITRMTANGYGFVTHVFSLPNSSKLEFEASLEGGIYSSVVNGQYTIDASKCGPGSLIVALRYIRDDLAQKLSQVKK